MSGLQPWRAQRSTPTLWTAYRALSIDHVGTVARECALLDQLVDQARAPNARLRAAAEALPRRLQERGRGGPLEQRAISDAPLLHHVVLDHHLGRVARMALGLALESFEPRARAGQRCLHVGE